MIRVSDVVRAVERYFEGGVAHFLNSSESAAAERAVHAAEPSVAWQLQAV